MTLPIIAVQVCVNYADKLRIALPVNAAMLEHIYVVTTEADTTTHDICAQHPNVTCLLSDKLHLRNAKFNKSALVRQGQEVAHAAYPSHWIMLLDADIVLPHEFQEVAREQMGTWDKEAMYGTYRMDYKTKTDYENKTNGKPYRFDKAGYVQIYYTKNRYYPEFSKNCSECDLVFGRYFPKYSYIPVTSSHLGVDFVNWDGRVSEQWE